MLQLLIHWHGHIIRQVITKIATTFLEQAVQLLPYDPEINDHLGDAYWQLGLKRQARFQWQRAIEQSPKEDILKKKSLKKLKKGL